MTIWPIQFHGSQRLEVVIDDDQIKLAVSVNNMPQVVFPIDEDVANDIQAATQDATRMLQCRKERIVEEEAKNK